MFNFSLCLLFQLQSTALCIYAALVVYAYLHMCPFTYMSHVHVCIHLYRHIYIYELCLQCVSQQCMSVCTLCLHMCIYTHRYLSIYMYICSSVQFISVTQSCPTLCDPMNCSTPGLPVHHQLPEFTQTHNHRVSDAIQPSHPLSSPSPAPNPSQHQSLFQ